MIIIAHYQVVIIGAGPAGISAGIKLQQSGLDCCIIEKAVFPRTKLCGGLITKKTIAALSELKLDALNDNLVRFQTNKVSIENRNSSVSSFECKIPFTLVERTDFDCWLLNKYKALGGKVIEGICVLEILSEAHAVVLDTNDKIGYDVLVGADGIRGISSKYVGNTTSPRAFGIETSIPTSRLVPYPQGITLDIGYLPDGYIWTFPKGPNTTIGLACSYRRDIDYVGILKKYISSKYGDDLEYKIAGSFLPYGKHKARITHKRTNLLLIGDAAGYIDCVTGEGIYFAVRSGIIAANTIIENYSNNCDRIISCYEKNCGPIVTLVNRSARFVTFFYKNRPAMLKIVKGHSRPLAYICDHQVSQYDYSFEFLRLIKDYFKQR